MFESSGVGFAEPVDAGVGSDHAAGRRQFAAIASGATAVGAAPALGAAPTLGAAPDPAVHLAPFVLDPFALARLGGAADGDPMRLTTSVLARAAAAATPGFMSAGMLALLGAGEMSGELAARLGEAGMLDVVHAIARLEGHLAGVRLHVLAALSDLPVDPPSSGVGSPLAADDRAWGDLVRTNRSDTVAALCGVSPYVATLWIRRARDLRPGGRLEQVGDELRAGRLPAAKAELMADELADVDDPALLADLVRAVLPHARTLGQGRLREAIRAEIEHSDPRRMIDDHHAARTARELTPPQAEGCGMASMRMLGPSADIARIWALIDAGARAAAPLAKDETRGALRFDALVALLACGAAGVSDDARSETRRRPAINVVVGIDTLLGADAPAELERYGTLDARTARQLAADPTGTWRRLLVDRDGRLIERSRAYRPPPTVASFILARDRTCRFPGCARTTLDIDHIIDYADDGRTMRTNLAGLCRTHHNLKTHRLWTYALDPESGDARWRDRHGNAAVQPAARYRRPRRHRLVARGMPVRPTPASATPSRATPAHATPWRSRDDARADERAAAVLGAVAAVAGNSVSDPPPF